MKQKKVFTVSLWTERTHRISFNEHIYYLWLIYMSHTLRHILIGWWLLVAGWFQLRLCSGVDCWGTCWGVFFWSWIFNTVTTDPLFIVSWLGSIPRFFRNSTWMKIFKNWVAESELKMMKNDTNMTWQL